jgi:hypothetical protein
MRQFSRKLASWGIVFFLAGPAFARDRPTQIREQADHLLSVGDFDGGAALLEHLAAVFPAQGGSDEGLAQAARVRLLLGQRTEGEADVEAYWKAYGRTRADEAARLTVALARDSMNRQEGRQAALALSAVLPRIDQSCSRAVREVAHVTFAEALDQEGNHAAARGQYGTVLAIAEGRPSGSAPDEEEARDAVAEAHFTVAERESERADAVVLPPFLLRPGLRDDDLRNAIGAYLRNVAYPILERREHAVYVAEAAHLRVLGVQARLVDPPKAPPCALCLVGGDPTPVLVLSDDPLKASWTGEPPSPRWAIASAARIGALWERFRQAIRQLPSMPAPPGTIVEPPESPPPYARARDAFDACLRLATRYQVVDEASSACVRGRRSVARWGAPPVDDLQPLPIWTTAWVPGSPVGLRHAARARANDGWSVPGRASRSIGSAEGAPAAPR